MHYWMAMQLHNNIFITLATESQPFSVKIHNLLTFWDVDFEYLTTIFSLRFYKMLLSWNVVLDCLGECGFWIFYYKFSSLFFTVYLFTESMMVGQLTRCTTWYTGFVSSMESYGIPVKVWNSTCHFSRSWMEWHSELRFLKVWIFANFVGCC